MLLIVVGMIQVWVLTSLCGIQLYF